MKSCGRFNVRKQKEIKNGENYMNLDIYLELNGLENREVSSSVSRNYMVRSGNGLTVSLTLRTIMSPNKKHKARTSNTEVFPQDFMRKPEDFKYIPYLR